MSLEGGREGRDGRGGEGRGGEGRGGEGRGGEGVYREQWYVIISRHRPGLTDNLLEAGCTNKLCPIPVKLPLLTIYLRILLP